MKRLLFTSLLLVLAINTYAYDFSIVYNTEQTLYFNITSDSTVALTYPGNKGVINYISYHGRYFDEWSTTSPYCEYTPSYQVSHTYSRPRGKIKMPQQVEYNDTTYTVTGIGDYAFYECNDLILVIPDGMSLTIGNQALLGVTYYYQSDLYYYDSLYYEDSTMTTVIEHDDSIRHVIFPNTVTSIASGLFSNDTLLQSITFDSNLSVIASNSFYGCINIRTLTIPDFIVIIDTSAFGNCFGIDSIYMGAGVTTISINAFSGCTNIRSMLFNAQRIVGSFWFPRNSLSTFIIGDSIRHIRGNICNGCTLLSSITIPNRVQSIGNNAFYGCSSLSSLIIPDGIDTIGEHAFYGCISLDSIYLGTNVRYIGKGAFAGIDSIPYFHFNARSCSAGTFKQAYNQENDNESFSIEYSGTNGTTYRVYSSGLGLRKKVNKLIIGDSVQTISTCNFYQYSIDTLVLGCGITSMGVWSFHNCNVQHLFYNIASYGSSLRDSSVYYNGYRRYYCAPFMGTRIHRLTIGDSVLSIPTGAFKYSSLNGSVSIPDNVRGIGTSAFKGCSNMDSIYLGCNIESVGENAFQGCSGIRSIRYNARNCRNAMFYGISLNQLQTITIEDSVRNIPPYCFSDMKFRNSLNLNLDSIGNHAFANCDSITSITINAQDIGSSAFADCDNLTSVIINVRNIGQSAFADCDRLSQVVLDDSVQIIGNNAFANCDYILSINTNARIIGNTSFTNCDRLVSVTLGDSVQTIGNGAFSGCFRLNNVSLGESITSIGGSAFRGCIRLIKPELPNSISTIGSRAFDGCGDINGKLTFPASITHIGDSAYNGVGTITEIEMKGSTPPTIHAHTFAAVDSLVTVSVPCEAILNYYITDYWENFPNIVGAPPYRLTVVSNNEVMGTATVTQQTTCTNHTATIYAVALTGYHFLQWNDGITTNPRIIPMTQDSTFTAIFVVNNSYITVHANDSTMGSVSGTGLYGYNAPVTLTATAYSGYHFLRWSDGNTQNPRYLAAVRDSSFTAIFVSNVSTITVANANPGMGNVGGSGVYYYQNLVSITATANYGYHFVQWNDGNTQNPRTIIVSQDSAFTAFFALNTYSIVATSNSTTMGSVSGGGQYTYLHEMSMTATPAYGYHFVQWNDGVTDNPRTLTVTRDSAFIAQFAANSYTLTVAANDATMGSAYGAGSYNYNTTATLSAVANYGYHFTQWSDAVTDNPRIVTVLNNATYTAQFAINSYTLTVQSSNPAIGTTSGSGSYNYLTPVNITALPNVGYHFVQWSDGNTTNPRLVSVTANATYTAQFAINSYAVGVTSNNSTMGYVSGSGTYNHNSTATLTATAYYGYHFVQWQDGNTQNPRSVTVTDSAQYTAQFDYNSYLVTALSSNVMVGTAIGGGTYNYLSQVALTGVPAPHYHFTMWNDSVEDNPRTITVTRDTTLTAHFSIDRHTIGVNTANATQGTASGSDTVDYNTAVWITATPNYGYHFVQWQDGNSSNPRRVVVSQDTVFTASFAPNQYTATCSANDNTRGTVTSAGGSYNYLTSLTFTAVPDANYHFLRWSNGSTDNPITFTLTRDTALTAIFVGLTATVNDNLLGTATHTKLANLVEEVTATPNYGYHFVQWQDGNSDNPRTVTLTQDTTMTAYFAVNTYYLTLVSNDSTMGTVTGSGSYNYLTQVTLTATANEHYHFVQWNDGNTTNPRLVTLTSDTTFIAQFEEDARYNITVSSNDTAMGTVSGSGIYYGGEQVVLTASPSEHHHFVQWGDGNTQNPRTITVVGDADYTAVFEADMFTITVTANDPTMGSVMGGGEYGYGTEVTIAAQPFAGYGFRGWNDGDTNRERTIVVREDANYQAIFYDMVGIEDVEIPDYSVSVEQNNIHIGGVCQRKIAVYDISGRRIAYIDKSPETFIVTVPATGVYLIQVEGMRARKVVVY